jgi:hypothetical protein
MLAYTLLFILILGFIHVAKFTIFLLAIIVWILAKIFCVELSFFDIIYGE